jgi:hypothetical protein
MAACCLLPPGGSLTTYRSCLDLANKRKLENLAFPAISTGVYGYPPAEAAEVRARVVVVVLWVGCSTLAAVTEPGPCHGMVTLRFCQTAQPV